MRRKKGFNGGIILVIIVFVVALIGGGAYFLLNDNDSSTSNVTRDKEKTGESSASIDDTDDSTSNSSDDTTVTEEEQKKEQEAEATIDYDFDTQTGEEVKVEANKVVEATGFSGASNYKFYLRGTTLYFRDVSVSTNEEEILAYNVKDLYLENKQVTAELYSDGEIVKENTYITYK